MKFIAGLVFASLAIGCGTLKTEKESKNNGIQRKWELSILDGKQIATNQPVYIELTADNKVTGFSGCNRFNGTYSIENGSQIKFNQLATTRMACRETEMKLENELLEVLRTTNNFSISDGKLMLNIGRRAPLAVFNEMSDKPIVNKYWKLKELDGKPVKMAEKQEREQYFMLRSDGSLSGFAGCNYFNGGYVLKDGNRISFNENLAISLKACPDVNVDEQAFLKVFGQANNYTIDNDMLRLNSGKKESVAVFEATYF